MRIATKYGLLITAGVAAWVLVKHLVLGSAPPWIDPLLFCAFQLAGLVFGMRERRASAGGLAFGDGVRTGLTISTLYGATACAFFGVLFGIMGPKLLEQAHESGVGEKSTAQVLGGAFAGMFIGALVTGLVFSLIVSAILRRPQATT